MKKVRSLLSVVSIALLMLTGCASTDTETEIDKVDIFATVESEYRVALITDYGDITDQSFNQTTYEACKIFCAQNCIDFEYYKPNENTIEEQIGCIRNAISDGYNVIVMPGYAFAGPIAAVSKEYEEIKFIALDVAEGDLLEAGVTRAGKSYDYNPANWNLEDYVYMDNVYCATYQEEISGYMAGYAAVKMGYRELGYLGGMAVPVVMRFGYGFVQGAEVAATELGVTDVVIKYAYGNQFFGDDEITAVMDTWYREGTEAVFACGGGIYSSVAEAASKNGGKVIGVDTDQAAVIDAAYGEGITITSAMKGLFPTTIDVLTDVVLNNNWSNYAGKIAKLGLVSKTEVESNYVQIPLASTQWSDVFTVEEYKTLVANIFDGKVAVSDDVSIEPNVKMVKVENLGNIK